MINIEDCPEVDELKNLPSSNGHKHIITMMDVFSRYFFAYPTQDMTARTVGRCIINVMTSHCFLPTVSLTDKGSQFRPEVVNQLAQTVDVTKNHASTKPVKAICKLGLMLLQKPHQKYQLNKQV